MILETKDMAWTSTMTESDVVVKAGGKICLDTFTRRINNHFGINMFEKTRKRQYVYLRQCFYFYAINDGYGCLSLERITGKDHSTILDAYKKVDGVTKQSNKQLYEYKQIVGGIYYSIK